VPDFSPLTSLFFDHVDSYREASMRMVASSSFQTQSMPLLHLISQVEPAIPVHFLDTGFHFAETLAFRDRVVERLGLELIVLESPVPKSAQLTSIGMMLFTADTDRCCHLNKTLPMEPVLAAADVWITGVRRDQSSTRASFDVEAPGRFGTTRFHPMLHWTKRDIWAYITAHDLPRHPLELEGYESIGCAPCTLKPSLDDRSGRWQGQAKTECGLHTVLATSS
jgi:phosphoadenosine phosphosulfate reductase